MKSRAWLKQVIQQKLAHVALLSHKYPFYALALAGALTLVCSNAAKHLTLNADLTDLLPHSFQSVKDLQKLKSRFGGIGYVVVVGQDAEPDQLKKFADDMTPKLRALPNIRFVEYQRENQFFQDHLLYYLELNDLKKIDERLQEREAYERRINNPLYLSLDDEPAPSIDFTDLKEKYQSRANQKLAGTGENYYLDKAERKIVLLAKPAGGSADLKFSKQMIADVEKLLAAQDLKKYGPKFNVALTGSFKKKLDEQQQIARDLKTSSLIALLLLLTYLAFHFRSFVAVALVLVPVSLSLTWIYGFVGVAYGSVNLLTAFLGAILGGLGIEHGIHLLGRYENLRLEGCAPHKAVFDTFLHTGSAALVSSLVAALTFLSLAISEFRAFSEFGSIAAVGMLIAWFAYMLVLPALLKITERMRWFEKSHMFISKNSNFALLISRKSKSIAWTVFTIIFILTLFIPKVRFNYDFSALSDGNLPSFQLDRKVNKILGYSQTPVVVLTDDETTERLVVETLNARKDHLKKTSTVDFVAALSDLVPKEQQEKKLIFASLQQTVDKLPKNKLNEKQREQLNDLEKMLQAEPFTRHDIPENIRRQFEGVKPHENGFVLVFPNISLADGQKVRAFANEVRQIALPNGQHLSAAGEAMILADILNMVTREALPILAAACLSVLLAMIVTLGTIRAAVICMLPTALSIVALLGLMPLVGLQFNYLNMVIVPILVGVTVDAGVHLITRLSEPNSDFIAVYAEVGRAICGGLLTSAVGFGAMLIAKHPGLNSLGQLANLGFATNLLIMLLAFPAFLHLRKKRNKIITAELI